MMTDYLATLFSPATTLLTTYLLHSTLLLLSARLVLGLRRTKSHALDEQIWKAAAVAGLITTPLHLFAFTDYATPILDLQFAQLEKTGGGNTKQASHLQVERKHISSHPHDSSEVTKQNSKTIGGRSENAGRTNFEFAPPQADPEPIESFDRAWTEFKAVETVEPEVAERASDFTDDSGVATTADIQPPADVPAAATEPKSPEFATATSTELSENSTDTQPRIAWLPLIVKPCLLSALLIALLSLFRLICRTAAFNRRVANLTPLNSRPARELLDELTAGANVHRRVALFSSTLYSEPVAFGMWRWRIVLPRDIEADLSREDLQALLAHELAHLVRGDAFWLWGGHLLCSLFAFQPLNFLARRGWQRAAEFRCDDWAVRQSIPPLRLARCLTRVAEWRRAHPACSATMAAGGGRGHLSDRVERLVADVERTDPWSSGARRLILLLSAVTVISVLVLWGPRATLWARPQELQAFVKLPVSTASAETDSPHEGPLDLIPETTRAMSLDEELKLMHEELELLLGELNALSQAVKRRPELQERLDHLRAGVDLLHERIAHIEHFHDHFNTVAFEELNQNHPDSLNLESE